MDLPGFLFVAVKKRMETLGCCCCQVTPALSEFSNNPLAMQLRSDIVSLLVVGISFALIGWGIVVLSAQIERGRQETTVRGSAGTR